MLTYVINLPVVFSFVRYDVSSTPYRFRFGEDGR